MALVSCNVPLAKRPVFAEKLFIEIIIRSLMMKIFLQKTEI